MGQIHQKGSLSAKHEAKRGRGASPMATLPERGPNEKETLAEEIRAHVKRRGLTQAQAARHVAELPARMLLLSAGKLYSFTVRQLTRIRDRLAE
ncbi:MAG: hypothetical protein JWL60_2167 [Gemmatimonadetes bacterium]|jgi:hypothetical protein|nr:hypothetical protein [Gemmatimonadota bacterium]